MCVDSVLFELMFNLGLCAKSLYLYYLSIPHLARYRTPFNLYKCVRACASAFVCQNEGECMRERERERERERGRAIHVLLIHSIFVVAFIVFFFSLLYVQYTYSGFVTNLTSSAAHRSVVRMTQVFDLEKCSISKTLLQVFKRENDLMQ